jgi:hypothetical protein
MHYLKEVNGIDTGERTVSPAACLKFGGRYIEIFQKTRNCKKTFSLGSRIFGHSISYVHDIKQ